jgi:hypothetical protein
VILLYVFPTSRKIWQGDPTLELAQEADPHFRRVAFELKRNIKKKTRETHQVWADIGVAGGDRGAVVVGGARRGAAASRGWSTTPAAESNC